MKHAIWTQPYAINTLVLNAQKRLGLFGVLNLLQDAAWSHADHLGHGYADMIGRGLLWVLTRQTLVMDTWPSWGDHIEIRTWVRPPTGALAHRDSEILLGGRPIGRSVASWFTLDAQTRRPAKLTLDQLACRSTGVLDLEAAKIPLRTNLDTLAGFRVRSSDLDMNGHVNNTRYAQWILDSMPPESHATDEVRMYEVNFLNETGIDDVVMLSCGALEPAPTAPRRLQFQGRRQADEKPVFAARLGIVER